MGKRPDFNLENEEWNATLHGDFLWSNVNFGEAVTDVMTPLSWSLIQFTLEDWRFLPGFPTVGLIGGRPYLNISIFATLYFGIGRSQEDLLRYMESTLYMQLAEGMKIPAIPLPRRALLAGFRRALGVQLRQRRGIRELPSYLQENPAWFQGVREQIQAQDNGPELRALWADKIGAHLQAGAWCVLASATHSADYTLNLRRSLARTVGVEDAQRLIANLSQGPDDLESLGPVAGLERLARGQISRQEYLAQYGHRGPQEFELSVPRPAEEQSWLDRELEQYRRSPVDVESLRARQQESFQAAWGRMESHSTRKDRVFKARIAESARRARQRELARSAYVRDRWAARLFALRAGELSGLGSEVFFLRLEEVLALLQGDDSHITKIPARVQAYKRYKALPTYPAVIRGRFDPFHWAADPNRPVDIYEEGSVPTRAAEVSVLKGSPGSAGRVEGVVRLIQDPQQGDRLQPGEILVAVQTDIAWTLLFPRAAAVITDVGAPLSHAAIVARELGIPAVVGCGNATALLTDGDRVRVDGSQGRVEILARATREGLG